MDGSETATGRCIPSCGEQHTYIAGLCELAIASINITGLMGPWGIAPDTPEQTAARRGHWTSDEDRDVREFALERAVQALTPVAGAFDFMPGHAIERRVSYADAITGLAEHFANYIRNGG